MEEENGNEVITEETTSEKNIPANTLILTRAVNANGTYTVYHTYQKPLLVDGFVLNLGFSNTWTLTETNELKMVLESIHEKRHATCTGRNHELIKHINNINLGNDEGALFLSGKHIAA